MDSYNRRTFLSECGLVVFSLALIPFSREMNALRVRKHSKKGIGLRIQPNNDWGKKLESLNVSWHYSWGLKPKEKERYPGNVQFVPMVWGSNDIENVAEYLKEQRKLGKIDSLLGFNEPDHKKQSNITVEKALELWPILMKIDARLGSPACINPYNEWMKTFMQQADERKLRIDFITIHHYGGPNPKALINKCKQVYEMYGRPIWITEFAVGDFQMKDTKKHKYSSQRVLKFMQGVLPELDKLDLVERYAWFPAKKNNKHLSTSALFNEDGKLTTLGRYYADYRACCKRRSKIVPL